MKEVSFKSDVFKGVLSQTDRNNKIENKMTHNILKDYFSPLGEEEKLVLYDTYY